MCIRDRVGDPAGATSYLLVGDTRRELVNPGSDRMMDVPGLYTVTDGNDVYGTEYLVESGQYLALHWTCG